MRREERAALAAIVASGLVSRTVIMDAGTTAKQALAIADAILNQTYADEEKACQEANRK